MAQRQTDALRRYLPGSPREFLTAPIRAQTYRNLVYLALAFPLGMAYFLGLVIGASFGLGLLITWIGLPILLGTLAATTKVASFEVSLAGRLVGTDAAVPSSVSEFSATDRIAFPGDGFVISVTELLTSPVIWTSVALVISKFAFGIVSFTMLVTALSVSVALLGAPLLYDASSVTIGLVGPSSSGYTTGPLVVDTLPEALVVAAFGVVVALVALNALNAAAKLQAAYTVSILRVGSGRSDDGHADSSART
ncbi:sensor domain-containing protein [Natronoarchaeum philippinense]|nr:sensor domain-containing protein [Natronoarchaeum philippinense]